MVLLQKYLDTTGYRVPEPNHLAYTIRYLIVLNGERAIQKCEVPLHSPSLISVPEFDESYEPCIMLGNQGDIPPSSLIGWGIRLAFALLDCLIIRQSR